jgi:hypothetical protein
MEHRMEHFELLADDDCEGGSCPRVARVKIDGTIYIAQQGPEGMQFADLVARMRPGPGETISLIREDLWHAAKGR